MPKSKIAITVDRGLLEELDRHIATHRFANRSQAIETALGEKLERISRTRLANECAKLNPDDEKGFAEEGLADALDAWPEY